jgi:hypothetical protein
MSLNEISESDLSTAVFEPLLWINKGWTARVIKNEDDEGWAVEMIKEGESEPALVGPWTMGRDKKNPKPLDASAFSTLVKTASEILMRHEQHLHAMFHQKISVSSPSGWIDIRLDIVPDEDDPHAWLGAYGANEEELARVRVDAGFKLNNASANVWINNEFRSPR